MITEIGTGFIMKNIKRISVLYIFMILLIIALADQGHLHYLKQIVFLIPYGDKWGHFFLIGLLAFFVNLWLNCEKLKVFKWFFLKGSVIILIIITLEEFSQIFIENRSYDVWDLISDYLGILVFGQLACYLTRTKAIVTSE